MMKKNPDLYRMKTCKVCGQAAPVQGWKNCGGCPWRIEEGGEKERLGKPGCPKCDGSGMEAPILALLPSWCELSKLTTENTEKSSNIREL